jgi:hypothetical protein
VTVSSLIPDKCEILKTFLDRSIPFLVNNKRGIKKDEDTSEFNKMDILYDFYMRRGLLTLDDE